MPDLSLAIASGEARRISAVKGVGKKTAEKICVELRDKVNAFEAMGAKQGSAKAFLRDAVLALSALGYGDENASKMVSQVIASHPDAADTETVIRLALAGR